MWSQYLFAYSWIVYNIGGLPSLENLRGIVGVSLFPWLKEGVNAQMVRIITQFADN